MTAVATPPAAPPATDVLSELAKMNDTLKKRGEEIALQQKAISDAIGRTERIPASGVNAASVLQAVDNANKSLGVAGGLPGAPGHAPNVMTGELPMNSRPFSFLRMLGTITGAVSADQAKNELGLSEKLCKYSYNAGFSQVHVPGRGASIMAPLGSSMLPTDMYPSEFVMEMKAAVTALPTADPDEVRWMAQKGYIPMQKAMSWLTETLGGALVAPPEQGEIIQLLRNREALVNAGARIIPLPPQGRLVYPRVTSPSAGYWLGENSQITASTIGTGEVILSAKKLAVLVQVPNELIRFASPAAEAVLRDDMTKTLALNVDLAGLEGVGSSNQPLGIINHANINIVTSSVPGVNGDTLVGKDIYRCIEQIEENNAEFEGWIMRPKTLYNFYQLRSDAAVGGDAAGPWLFNLIREAGDEAKPMLAGYPVTKSTQVSRTQVKGNASNLTYIVGGMWSDLLIGMFGAIEFAATTLGDTPFQLDQTWVRAIVSCDIKPRHEVSFVLLQNLITS